MKDTKNINLDTRESNEQYISVVQFDSNSRVLRACITSNGEALDLTGHSVMFSAIKPDGYDIFNECAIVNASAGLVDIVLSQQALAKGGIMDCQCKIVGTGNSILSTQTFQIHINKSTMSVTMTSSNEYDALTKALSKVQSIDNKAEKSEVDVERKRIDNLTKLPAGSTTGDAELIDARVGADGKTYTNVGDAMRTQNKTIIEDQDTLLDLMVHTIADNAIHRIGYLTATGGVNNDQRLHSKTTRRIRCYEGWIFRYTGNGNAKAVSWILYNNKEIVDTGQYVGTTDITIPNGVTHVVFSSYSGISKDIKLNVQLIHPYAINDKTIVHGLDSKLNINAFIPEMRSAFIQGTIPINANDMTKVTGVYASKQGGLITSSSYNCYEMEVSAGQSYHYEGYVIWDLAPYHLYDDFDKPVEIGKADGDYDTQIHVITDIIIPDGVTKLLVCSGGPNGEKSFSLTKNIAIRPPSKSETFDLIENHSYDGVGEYVDITSRYELIRDGYLNSNGNINSDTNSERTDYLLISDIGASAIYVDARCRYSTTIMAIYDSTKKCLGVKASAPTDGETTWNKHRVDFKELTQEFPQAIYIRLCSYLFKSNPLKIHIKQSTVGDIYRILDDKISRMSNGSNVLYGKKYVACGDSFTEGDFSGYTDENGLSGKNSPKLYDSVRGMYKTYPWWIAERNNMTLINEAKCGSTMALSKEYIDGTQDIGYRNPFSLNRYKQVPLDADYLTLWFGLNESSPSRLGTLNDTTNETILGAWNIVLEYFLTNMPYCKIGIVISDGWLNETVANGIISVAEYWGIPYLDMRNNPQVPLMLGGRGNEINLNPKAKTLRNNAFYVTSSNGHPNVEAHEYQSTFIEHWLRSL